MVIILCINFEIMNTNDVYFHDNQKTQLFIENVCLLHNDAINSSKNKTNVDWQTIFEKNLFNQSFCSQQNNILASFQGEAENFEKKNRFISQYGKGKTI